MALRLKWLRCFCSCHPGHPSAPCVPSPPPPSMPASSSASSLEVRPGLLSARIQRPPPRSVLARGFRGSAVRHGAVCEPDDPMGAPDYAQLLRNNREWVQSRNSTDPEYFRKLSQPQSPPYLYIGCSDSRMALNQMLGCKPGYMFVHRNIANQVSVTDMGILSVLSYAVDSLRVSHIIVCGHYDCGGVKSAIYGETDGSLVANWVNPIKRVYTENKQELLAIPDKKARLDRLSELNVLQQVHNLCQTSSMRAAFRRNAYPELHGWILDIYTGLVKELELPIKNWVEQGYLPESYLRYCPTSSPASSVS
eukprot:RCo052956